MLSETLLWLAIYASDNRPLSILSILNQYFNIDKTTEKYRGYLPSIIRLFSKFKTNLIYTEIVLIEVKVQTSRKLQTCNIILYMIDSNRRPVSSRRPLLKSASTDVIISNHGPISGYSQIGVLSKLSYPSARPPERQFCFACFFYLLFIVGFWGVFLFCVFFLSIFPFFDIINRGRIYFGGPRK